MHPISGVFASKPPKILLLGLLITYHCLSPFLNHIKSYKSIQDSFKSIHFGHIVEDKRIFLEGVLLAKEGSDPTRHDRMCVCGQRGAALRFEQEVALHAASSFSAFRPQLLFFLFAYCTNRALHNVQHVDT
jgi:hypothetical protein